MHAYTLLTCQCVSQILCYLCKLSSATYPQWLTIFKADLCLQMTHQHACGDRPHGCCLQVSGNTLTGNAISGGVGGIGIDYANGEYTDMSVRSYNHRENGITSCAEVACNVM